MRLVSGAPYWLVRNGLPLSAITTPLSCDVAIVGAGITGALVADALAGAGFTVTVLDRREPAVASTAASTALLTYELDVELTKLISLIGESGAMRAYRACSGAIGTLQTLVGTLGDDCGFARLASMYLARSRRDARRLGPEADARMRCGLDTALLSGNEITALIGAPSFGGLRTSDAGVVDPVRLVRALLARAQSAGAQVCSRTEVLGWTSDPSGVRVATNRGEFEASWIVLATGYETPKELRDGLVSLQSTYALATMPVDASDFAGKWDDRCLIWDSGRPYSYIRADADRVIIGGEDVTFMNADARDRLLPRKTARLEQRLREVFPFLRFETEFAWAGTFGATRDGLPYIGPHSGLPRALFALGYGGNGILFSVIAARILRNIILGEGDEDAELFSLERGA